MIRPLNDIVLIRREPEEEKHGEILIPKAARQKSNKGTVVACGPGLFKNGKRRPMGVCVGDVVFWNAYIGEEVEVEGEKLVAMHEDEIEAVA